MKRAWAIPITVLVLLPACSGLSATTAGEVFPKGQLAEGFPPDFPLPKDARLVQSEAGEDKVQAAFSSREPNGDITTLMVQSLPKAGWKLVECIEFPDKPERGSSIIATKGTQTTIVGVGEFSAQVFPDLKKKRSLAVVIIKAGSQFQSRPGADVDCQ